MLQTFWYPVSSDEYNNLVWTYKCINLGALGKIPEGSKSQLKKWENVKNHKLPSKQPEENQKEDEEKEEKREEFDDADASERIIK